MTEPRTSKSRVEKAQEIMISTNELHEYMRDFFQKRDAEHEQLTKSLRQMFEQMQGMYFITFNMFLVIQQLTKEKEGKGYYFYQVKPPTTLQAKKGIISRKIKGNDYYFKVFRDKLIYRQFNNRELRKALLIDVFMYIKYMNNQILPPHYFFDQCSILSEYELNIEFKYFHKTIMGFEFFRKNLYFIYSAINFEYKNRKKIKEKITYKYNATDFTAFLLQNKDFYKGYTDWVEKDY